jgi:hypothetical protein
VIGEGEWPPSSGHSPSPGFGYSQMEAHEGSTLRADINSASSRQSESLARSDDHRAAAFFSRSGPDRSNMQARLLEENVAVDSPECARSRLALQTPGFYRRSAALGAPVSQRAVRPHDRAVPGRMRVSKPAPRVARPLETPECPEDGLPDVEAAPGRAQVSVVHPADVSLELVDGVPPRPRGCSPRGTAPSRCHPSIARDAGPRLHLA